MEDKKESRSSLGDLITNLVSRSDSKGVDSSRSSVIKDKVRGGDLSPEESIKVDKIAVRFGKILKVGAFSEGPEARRNVGTKAISEKVEGIDIATKAKDSKDSKDSGGLGGFLGKLGIAAAVIGGLLLAFKDNEGVQKVLAKFSEVFSDLYNKFMLFIEDTDWSALLDKFGKVVGFLAEKIKQFINMDWDALDLAVVGIVAIIGGVVGIKILAFLATLSGSLLTAAIGVGIMVAALYGLAKILPMFEKINWETIGKAGAALAGLGAIGLLGTKLIVGAVGIGALALALFGVSKALEKWEEIDWETIGKAGAALAGLGAIGAVLGIFIKPVLLGAVALLALGAALYVVALAVDKIAPGLTKLIGAVANFYEKVLEKLPPIIAEIGKLVIGVLDSIFTGIYLIISKILDSIIGSIDSVANGISTVLDNITGLLGEVGKVLTGVLDSLSSGISTVLDSIKDLIGSAGDVIVKIADRVSDSISKFFDKLSESILKLNGVDTDKLKQIGPALKSIGEGLLSFGTKGLLGEILTGLGSLFGADSPLEKFQKLGEVAPKIQSIPKALEELSKYKNLEFLTNIDSKEASINKLNKSLYKLKGTVDKLPKFTYKEIKVDITRGSIDQLTNINSALLNLIAYTNNLKNTNLGNLTDSRELNVFGVFSDDRTVTSINNVNSALLNLLDTQEKLKANSKDLKDITGSFNIKTLSTSSDTNIKNLTANTTEYHSYAKTAMNDQIKRQDTMIDLLRQLVMKPTGSAAINTNASMQQNSNRTFDIRDQFSPYTLLPNNLTTS